MLIKDYTLALETKGFCHVIDITRRVQEKVDESGIWSGNVTVFVIGSTAAITTAEYEPGLLKDLEELFDRLVPPTRDYHHEEAWHDGNGFSHVRAAMLKPSLTIPLMRGRMRLGSWQQLIVLDFDNRSRDREVAIQVLGHERPVS
jgi:secondary thiamine-phosphate synthase enzyme